MQLRLDLETYCIPTRDRGSFDSWTCPKDAIGRVDPYLEQKMFT